jgi:hypothetical protein
VGYHVSALLGKIYVNKMCIHFYGTLCDKSVLKPVVVCGCGTWPMTEKSKFIINTREKKMLRKISEPVTKRGVWRTKNSGTWHRMLKQKVGVVGACA